MLDYGTGTVLMASGGLVRRQAGLSHEAGAQDAGLHHVLGRHAGGAGVRLIRKIFITRNGVCTEVCVGPPWDLNESHSQAQPSLSTHPLQSRHRRVPALFK